MGLLDPVEGCILISGKNLQDPSVKQEWFRQIAHVPQNVFLLDESIRHNIVFGRDFEDITPLRLDEVVTVSLLDEFLARLPRGLDTVVGERGIRLSGGQRQRIGIARALMKPAQVYVFDEATSQLDEATEAEFLRRFFKFAQNKTIIFITHRASVLKYVDEVIEISAQTSCES